MSAQMLVRRRLAALVDQQAHRRERWGQIQQDMNALLEKTDREIENLKSQLTIEVVR